MINSKWKQLNTKTSSQRHQYNVKLHLRLPAKFTTIQIIPSSTGKNMVPKSSSEMEKSESRPRVRQPLQQEHVRDQDSGPDTCSREPVRDQDTASPDGETEPTVQAGQATAFAWQPSSIADVGLPQRDENRFESSRSRIDTQSQPLWRPWANVNEQ